MKRSLICCGALLLFVGARAAAQLPDTCKQPASAAHPPAGTPPARVYDAVGVWFAENGELQCAVAAFKQALRLEPRLAEAHFDLGLVRQSQQQPAAAISEFRLALQYDPSLLQAHCALGTSLADPNEAGAEFRKALAVNPQLVCALDGMAQVLMKERRYDAAADDWRQALRIQPDAPDLQLALATATYKAAKARQADGLPALDGEGVADAIRLLTDLLKSHPDMAAAYLTLGNIYANEHRDREAADEYQQVARRSPADTAAQAAQVKALIDASAFAEALEPARNYVRREPNDPSAHVMLGTVYQQLGDYTKAEPELELGAARAPDDFEARYQLGLVFSRMGKPDRALPQLQKAVALKPGDRSAQYQLVAVLRALGQTQRATQIIEELRKEQGKESLNSQLASEGTKANDLLQSGKAAEAAQVYRHMLEENPDSAWTAYNLALALEAMNDRKGAEDALSNAIDIDPKLAKIRAELGRLKLAEGDLQSAQKWLTSALDLEPELVDARGNLAMIYARQGDLVSADKLLRQALEDDPKYKEGHLNLGLILAQQNRKSDAEKELDQAVALAPKDPATLSTVGKAELQMGKVSQGIALLRQVVDLAPDLAAAHLDLALALAESYNLSAALAQTSEAVRLAPQSGVAHFYRGRILYDLGRSNEAQPEFETACRLDAQMPEPRYFLALIYKQQGKSELAANLLEETVKLQPGNVMAWYMLGQSLNQESKTAEAIAAWRKAIAIDPKFSQALFSLAGALRSTDRAESERLMAHYLAVQKERSILDRADTLANNGVEAASAHDWPEAIRQLNGAIAACGDCAAKADLHRKLGIIDCQAGDLNNGEKELLAAKALKPDDPVTQAALELIAQARSQHSVTGSAR
ncbi:MAG TPA: tetratricopeptide repeat protein [Terracidiphilus sp.]|jgi:tetratricopeptide (TPR) repeat protein|nr:tetratricopeptide repeat protein [Terracidiphilus sp.]